MQHVFLINPVAGKSGSALTLIPEIQNYFEQNGGDHIIYQTRAKSDATSFVREHSAQANGAPVRYYACGGDGTLMEVLNGCFGAKNVELASVPCGSANDFIRNFGSADEFLSISGQVNGSALLIDAIDANGLKSVSICAVGMDADVADKMIHFKSLPLVSGRMAYTLAIAYMFVHKIGRQLSVVIETETGEIHKISGNFLFSLAANGQYYGGNRHSSPQASLTDGLLDFQFIDTVGRMEILKFLSKYDKGTHLDMPIVHLFRGTKMTVTSPVPVCVVVDGECAHSTEIVFSVIPKSVNFVIPNTISQLTN